MQEAVPETTPMPSITENVVKFKQTKNPYYLAKAIFMVLKRGRTHELLYGIYCKAVHPASPVTPTSADIIDPILQDFEENKHIYKREFLSVPQLKEIYGDKFAINKIPSIFAGTRSESIIETENSLILGEYGMDNNSARIALVTKDDCIINDHYMHESGIRHIHALHSLGNTDNNDFLVATGDRLKVLDEWSNDNTSITYTKRLKRFLAGYTAMVKVNGEFYFGTDFTARPNYIEMRDGTKFFFPETAYTMFVMNFKAIDNRYLLALSSSLDDFGSLKALSIFDTVDQCFVYCEPVELPD